MQQTNKQANIQKKKKDSKPGLEDGVTETGFKVPPNAGKKYV